MSDLIARGLAGDSLQDSAEITRKADAFMIVTPEMFGAKGDGVTDDAAAWQAALDFGKDTGLFTIVKAKAGATYLARNLNPKSNTIIDLTGAKIQHGGTRSGVTVDGSAATIYANGTAENPIVNLHIIGGTVRGVRINYTDITGVGGNDGLYLYHCPNVTVEKVTLEEHGQDACTFDLCNGAKFLNNIVRNTGDGGIELRAGADYEVSGNIFDTCRNGVSTKPNVQNVVITKNKISSFNEAILVNGINWKVSHNTLIATTSDAINGANYNAIRYADDWPTTIPSNPGRDIKIKNNTIRGYASSAAFAIESLSAGLTLTGVSFTGNTVETCNRGVSFSSPVEIEISRNSMTVTDRGIWAASTSAVVSVSGNIITTTTNYCVDVACPNAIISLNRLTCAATSAINLASTATDATVNGNQVKCTGTSSGIAMSGARCSASGNDISTVAAPCVNILGADCSMNGGVLRPTGGEGIILGQSGSATSGLRATVSAVRITSGTQGIRVYADGCAIVGNNISGAQYWGVNVMSDAAATLVSSNVLAGNTSGGLQDAGTNTVNANNVLTV